MNALSLLTAITLLSGISANANETAVRRPQAPVLYSQFLTMDIDKNFGNDTYISGYVALDLEKNEILFSLQPQSSCPVGRMCLAVMPMPYEVTIPVSEVHFDRCGATIYVAKRDLRPVDGAMQQIVVTDNSTNICLTRELRPMVKVTYDTEFFRRYPPYKNVKTHSNFFGSVLEVQSNN